MTTHTDADLQSQAGRLAAREALRSGVDMGISAYGTVAVGFALLVLAVLCHWKKRLPRLRLWLYLTAGACMAFTAAAQLGAAAANWAVVIATPQAERWLGIGAGGLTLAAAIALIFFLIEGLHPKKGKPAGWYGPLYFVTPALLSALGTFAALTIFLRDTAETLVTTVGMG